MQRVQNAAVCFIYNVTKNEHISQYLKMAHFLPIKAIGGGVFGPEIIFIDFNESHK